MSWWTREERANGSARALNSGGSAATTEHAELIRRRRMVLVHQNCLQVTLKVLDGGASRCCWRWSHHHSACLRLNLLPSFFPSFHAKPLERLQHQKDTRSCRAHPTSAFNPLRNRKRRRPSHPEDRILSPGKKTVVGFSRWIPVRIALMMGFI
uniref:Uncharacterized protein n=1 Tax=Arundo donax TaxID=35708 RepID=A0A0A9BII7_ARUDO